MNSNLEDEFVAVRVQDPRIQQEGSWNSYVDYKIFLHTNSKAFTAKTSCVRRRYSEFAWLKKKLQKNTGLVQVPDLPVKSFFSFSNEDFLESRRKGLQVFLDKVLHMTVCLSDSQLHLFLQTQLPVGHIQDCVQGHTPYSVTDAILTYASSNWGFAQAQEDDANKEPSLTVSYESMESPAPHLPCLQTQETLSPQLLPCRDSDPLAGLLECCDKDTSELQHKRKSSIQVSQKDNHLKAVVERDPTEATFFLGDGQDDYESHGPAERTQPRNGRIQTPAEVHSPMGTGFERNRGVDSEEGDCKGEEEEEIVLALDTEETVVPLSEMRASSDHEDRPRWETNTEEVTCGSEISVNSIEILDFKDNDSEEQAAERNDGPQEDLLGVFFLKTQVQENHVISDHGDATEGPASNISFAQGFNSDPPDDQSDRGSCEPGVKEEKSDIHAESDDVSGLERGEEEPVETKDAESDEDSRSLPSSNDSIVKVSDEESVYDEADDSIRAADGYVKACPGDVSHWTDADASSKNILDLEMNGCPVEKEAVPAQEEEPLEYTTSQDLNSAVAGVDLGDSSDFSVLETGSVDGKRTEESLDPSGEAHEVRVL